MRQLKEQMPDTRPLARMLHRRARVLAAAFFLLVTVVVAEWY